MELAGKAKKGQGYALAAEILKSGKAHTKLQQMIDAQGRKNIPLKPGKFTADIKAPRNGVIKAINNKLISRYARMAGAPLNMGAGMYVHAFIGDKVVKGQKLFTIYAETAERLENTVESIKIEECYKIM